MTQELELENPADHIRILATSQNDIETVAKFLKPFSDANQILPRSPSELETLVRHAFMAILGDQMVGFAAVEIYSRKLAEIQCLTVAPGFQGRGIGQQLVNRCVATAQEKGVFEVMAITATEDLFRRCGFDYSLPQQKRAMFIQTGEKRTLD